MKISKDDSSEIIEMIKEAVKAAKKNLFMSLENACMQLKKRGRKRLLYISNR